jgi:hypothetical protein
MIFRNFSGVEPNGKNLRKLLNTKRSNRHGKALKEAMSTFTASSFNP